MEGLHIHLIIATLEEQERQDESGEDAAGAELEEEDEEEQGEAVQDLAGVKVELVDGLWGSRWLILDDVHICHKKREYSNETKWRCAYYNFKCPFILSTKKIDGEVVLVKMADPMSHLRQRQSSSAFAQVSLEVEG